MSVEIIQVQPETFREQALAVYQKDSYSLSAMFANDERETCGQFAVYCVFFSRRGEEIIVVKTWADKSNQFPSLTPVIPAAGWYEREIHDLFGLEPVRHPDLRPLVCHENWPKGLYPLRKDFSSGKIPVADEEYPIPKVQGEGIYEVPVGPIHAGIIEPGHFRFSQAGENIVHLEAKLFFTHRGIEKSVEGLTFEDAFYRIERVCGVCSVSHAISYAQAVEALCGIVIPKRALYLRVLAAELERLYNHVGDVGNMCAGLAFAPGSSHGGRLKEHLMRLNEVITGNRFLRGWVIPGGVAKDITSEIVRDVTGSVSRVQHDFSEIISLLKDNDAFLNRVETTGTVPHQAAIDLGVVGVAARASGVNTDLRRDHPYAAYKELEFKVPVYESGDAAARLWVRADEVFQSIHLVKQVLSDMPPGRLKTGLEPARPFGSAMGWSESPRGGNLIWIMADAHGRIYRCFVRSASYPNWPAVALAAPGNIIPDFPLINKSFELCYACLDR